MAATAAAAGCFNNLTAEFIRLRAEHKRKKYRFGTPIHTAGGGRELGPSNVKNGVGVYPDSRHGLLEGQPPFSPLGPNSSTSHQSTAASRDPSVLSHGQQVNIEMFSISPNRNGNMLPPVWVDLVEECKDDISRLKERLSALQKYQQRRLLNVFGNESQLSHPDKDVTKITNEISMLLHDTEGKIKTVKVDSEADEDAVHELRSNAQKSLAKQLQSVSNLFRKQQQIYMKELQKRSGSLFEDDLLGTFNAAAARQTPQLMQQQTDILMQEDVEAMEREIKSRNEETYQIAKSVADLNSIFQELAVLVIDQGTVLDRIDFNVEKVVGETRQANTQIRKAVEYQKNSLATRVTKFLIVGIIILVLIMIWKHL